MKSAERVMAILHFLATRVQPAPSMTIARECQLPRSSAYHLLNSMRAKNFVTYYPNRRAWGLGPTVFEIGSAYLRGKPLTWLARPLLREIAEATGATAHLAILQGKDVLYLVREDPPGSAVPLVSRAGLRLPAHLTAVGRAILMRMPSSHVQAIYPLTDSLVRRTNRGPGLVSELQRELADCRDRGYAIDDGMTTPGVICVAATVFSHEDQPIAGLGITLAPDQRARVSNSDLSDHVVRAATELSVALGWSVENQLTPDYPGPNRSTILDAA